MTDMESHSAWSRQDRLAFAVLIGLVLVGLSNLVHPWHDFANDASIYLSTTRALIDGEGYSYLGMPFHLRPVGFSLLLAPVMLWVDADPGVLNYYVAGFAAGSLLLLFVWARPWLGAGLSLLVCLVIGTNPVFLKLSSQVMSDVPGLFFVLLALIAARASERRTSLGNEILLGVLIGVAAHVRVLGIMLLPAVLIDRLLRWHRDPQGRSQFASFAAGRCLPLIATTLIVFAPWVVRNQLTALEPPTDQLLNYSYSTAMFHYDFGNPDSALVSPQDWGHRLLERGSQITAGLATRLASSTLTPVHGVMTAAVLALFLHGLLSVPGVAGFFVLLGLGITGSYFAYQDRLLLPIFVLLLPLSAASLHRAIRRVFAPRVATGVVAVLLAALVGLDFSPRADWPAIEARDGRMRHAAKQLESRIPAEATLASVRGFHLHMLLDRPVYSLRWAGRRAAGVAGIESVIERYGIDTVILEPSQELDRSFEPYFVERSGAGLLVDGFRVIPLTSATGSR